ncbi:hypothetical protein SAY86_024744 [Trapa natans]|uniref:HhH-GPD domain-containing protein n=1 Tax=Trapa natans TaxID=22666 RepID=A0AAN7M774_TRANT|nr:hypothetical protein SAY86_024744 [Trapa natans]
MNGNWAQFEHHELIWTTSGRTGRMRTGWGVRVVFLRVWADGELSWSMERKRTLGLVEGQEQEEKIRKEKAKTRRKTGIVVSRFFQDGVSNEHDPCCISGSSRRRSEKKRSRADVAERVVSPFFQKNEVCIRGRPTDRRKRPEKVVSRFFQNREQEVGSTLIQCSQGDEQGCLLVGRLKIDESIASSRGKVFEKSDANEESIASSFFHDREPTIGLELRKCSIEGRHSGLVVENGEIDEIGEPAASTAEEWVEKSDSKEKVISRFFDNQETGADLKLLRVSERGSPNGVSAMDGWKESPDIDELFSCFAYKKGCNSIGLDSREEILSAHFRSRKVISDPEPSTRKRIAGTALKAPVVNGRKEIGRRSRNPSALEKDKEAYKRKDSNNTWKPPRSELGLLQEDHAYDPWRVLVICMLLNITTGRQTGKILERLFSEFPDAKAAAEAPVEGIEEIIKTLGLQKKRAHMIKRMSQEYLGENWTHVTQLHGVGKYAADAYAIFCTGKWYEVTPVDHKLKDYWDYLWANKDRYK